VNRPRQRLLVTSEAKHTDAFHPFDWVLLLTAAGIWGSSFFFIAVGLEDFEPGVITLGRVVFGAIALWALPAARRTRIDRADHLRVALLGVCWMAFPLSMYSFAEQWIDSSLAGMLTAATPIWTALVASALLRRVPGSSVMAGLVVGFAGVGVLSWPSLEDVDASALGVLMVLLATVSYGIASNVAVPLQQRYGAIPVLARAQLVAIVLLVPAAAIGAPDSDLAADSLAAVVALGVLGTGLAFVAGATLMGRVGATRGTFITYVAPLVSIALGVAFRDEVFDEFGAIGVVLVLIGAYLASRAETVKEPVLAD
jgi:drug/metabolite transporter (DMT)-like permease